MAPTGRMSVHFLTLESQKKRVPLYAWHRKDGPAFCGCGPQECALREVGGGFRMEGTQVNLWPIHVDVLPLIPAMERWQEGLMGAGGEVRTEFRKASSHLSIVLPHSPRLQANFSVCMYLCVCVYSCKLFKLLFKSSFPIRGDNTYQKGYLRIKQPI